MVGKGDRKIYAITAFFHVVDHGTQATIHSFMNRKEMAREYTRDFKKSLGLEFACLLDCLAQHDFEKAAIYLNCLRRAAKQKSKRSGCG